MAYAGVTVGMACTSYVQFGGCAAHDLDLPGLLIAFLGVCLTIVGLGSLLSYRGQEARPVAALHDADAALLGQAESTGNLLFTALVGLGLAIAEGFPLYNIALLTMEAKPPTFDPVLFTGIVALFAVGDAFVLFLLYTWTESQ